jgi:chorismate mutase/prephenate dehydratase
MSEDRIQRLREKIGGKDRRIVRLLNERSALSLAIGRVKHAAGRNVYDPARESKIYRSLEEINEGPLPAAALADIFREILSASRALQAVPAVSYLGPEASFSHAAALAHFGKSASLFPAATIGEVFDAAERDSGCLGIVPIENSTEGSVKSTLDRLIATPLALQAEIFVRIRQVLLSPRGRRKALKRIYSHPQAIAQCRQWLRANLPQCRLIEVDSTAAAAGRALEDPEGGAIGSHAAASRYGLRIDADGIEDHPLNTTRFVVIGRGTPEPTGRDKTSILFGTAHAPGALHKALAPFASARVNLTRIESYPVRDRMWEYLFFMDFSGHAGEDQIRSCLRKLEKRTAFVKVLGSYPRGEERP